MILCGLNTNFNPILCKQKILPPIEIFRIPFSIHIRDHSQRNDWTIIIKSLIYRVTYVCKWYPHHVHASLMNFGIGPHSVLFFLPFILCDCVWARFDFKSIRNFTLNIGSYSIMFKFEFPLTNKDS